jgi:transcriptional regulator with XRE-family HTH domain
MPIKMPDWAWTGQDIRQALRARDVASIFRFAQQYGGASQGRIAAETGILQGRVSEIMNGGRRVVALEVFERVAEALSMPDGARMLLGLAPANPTRQDAGSPWEEISCAYPSQAEAVQGIRAAASIATSIEVVAVRGLGIVGLNDSLLRSPFFHATNVAERRFRVLLLDPASVFAGQRAAEIKEPADSFSGGIMMTITRMRQLAAESDVAIEVYQYRALPIWRLIIIDGTMYVSMFGDRSEGHESPVYRLVPAPAGALYQGFRRFCHHLYSTSERVV